MSLRILMHVIALDSGGEHRVIATEGVPLGHYDCPIAIGDRVSIRPSTGQVTHAKIHGIGTYLGTWWSHRKNT